MHSFLCLIFLATRARHFFFRNNSSHKKYLTEKKFFHPAVKIIASPQKKSFRASRKRKPRRFFQLAKNTAASGLKTFFTLFFLWVWSHAHNLSKSEEETFFLLFRLSTNLVIPASREVTDRRGEFSLFRPRTQANIFSHIKREKNVPEIKKALINLLFFLWANNSGSGENCTVLPTFLLSFLPFSLLFLCPLESSPLPPCNPTTYKTQFSGSFALPQRFLKVEISPHLAFNQPLHFFN